MRLQNVNPFTRRKNSGSKVSQKHDEYILDLLERKKVWSEDNLMEDYVLYVRNSHPLLSIWSATAAHPVKSDVRLALESLKAAIGLFAAVLLQCWLLKTGKFALSSAATSALGNSTADRGVNNTTTGAATTTTTSSMLQTEYLRVCVAVTLPVLVLGSLAQHAIVSCFSAFHTRHETRRGGGSGSGHTTPDSPVATRAQRVFTDMSPSSATPPRSLSSSPGGSPAPTRRHLQQAQALGLAPATLSQSRCWGWLQLQKLDYQVQVLVGAVAVAVAVVTTGYGDGEGDSAGDGDGECAASADCVLVTYHAAAAIAGVRDGGCGRPRRRPRAAAGAPGPTGTRPAPARRGPGAAAGRRGDDDGGTAGGLRRGPDRHGAGAGARLWLDGQGAGGAAGGGVGAGGRAELSLLVRSRVPFAPFVSHPAVAPVQPRQLFRKGARVPSSAHRVASRIA